MNIKKWEEKFQDYLKKYDFKDGSHDIYHFKRVWEIADKLCEEKHDRLSVLAACYFHDIVSYPKNHPDRSKSSVRAAEKAIEILKGLEFPEEKLKTVFHAIEAHSFSAAIECKSEEAKIVQDADRMEALGAIGLARTFYVAGMLGSRIFDGADPFAKNRDLDDKSFAIDHFYVKLLKLPETMKTEQGKKMAKKRADVLVRFLEDLKEEV